MESRDKLRAGRWIISLAELRRAFDQLKFQRTKMWVILTLESAIWPEKLAGLGNNYSVSVL